MLEYEYFKCMMHLLWYLQNNLFVPENTILQIRLFAFIVYFFSPHWVYYYVLNPLNKPVFEPIVYDVLLCTIFFFLLIFCRLFKICLKRDKHATQLLLAYCSRNCVYKNYQHARVEYDSFCLSFIVVVFYTAVCLRYIHMII